MKVGKKSSITRIIALFLVFAMLIPMTVNAAEADIVQPRASDYLSSYRGYVSVAGSGKIHLCFSVTGTGYMDQLGALQIAVYESTDKESWTWKKTYSSNTYSSMIGTNKLYHSGYFTYQGVAGRYYKAYIGVYAGNDGSGDTRYFWTSVKKAT